MKLKLVEMGSAYCNLSTDDGGIFVARALKRQDAQTIAHRVNCFDELVDALEYAIDWVDGPMVGHEKAKARILAALEKTKP